MFAELRKAGGGPFEFSLEERLWATAAAVDTFDLCAVARRLFGKGLADDISLGEYC